MAPNNNSVSLATTAGIAALFYVSHSFDWAHLYRSFSIIIRGPTQPQLWLVNHEHQDPRTQMTHQHDQHDGEGDEEQHEQSNESTPSGDDDEPDSVASIPLNTAIMKATNRQQQVQNEQEQEQQQQYIAHRLLQWFVTESVVSSRDLDFNWHMSNARYSRHADFARFQVFLQTGFRMALRAVDRHCGLVVSALSQKFRRELRWGQQYQIWVRIVGWDQRHFYLEHIFCTRTTTGYYCNCYCDINNANGGSSSSTS
jgi:acyl-CoA thioesterase FadM